MANKFIRRLAPLLCALALLISLVGPALITPASAASVLYDVIDIGTPDRIFNDDGTVSITYNLALDPYSAVDGRAPGSTSSEHIYSGDQIFFEQETQEVISYVRETIVSYNVNCSTSSSNSYYDGFFYDYGSYSSCLDFYAAVTHIIFDGVMYPVSFSTYSGTPGFGNFNKYSSKYPNTGEPFFVYCLTGGSGGIRIHGTKGAHTVEFVAAVPVVEYISPWASIYATCYPLGRTPSGGYHAIDISDIKSGSGFTLSFDLALDMYASTDVSAPDVEFEVRYMDSGGNLVSSDSGHFSMSSGDSLRCSLDFVVPAGAEYLFVYFITHEIPTDGVSYLGFNCNSLSVTTDLSSIENNTQMMDGIIHRLDEISSKVDVSNSELGEISSLLQQILDQMGGGSSSGGDMAQVEQLLQDLNNRQDELISGGPAGDDLIAGGDKLDQGNQQLGGVIGDLGDANNALPNMPGNIQGMISGNVNSFNNSGISDLMPWADSEFAPFWDILITPLVVSLGVAILMYFVFGKAK